MEAQNHVLFGQIYIGSKCLFNCLIDQVVFQGHDTQEAVWGGGQLAPGSGQCAGALPKVYGDPSDPPTVGKVSTPSQSVLQAFSSHFRHLKPF